MRHALDIRKLETDVEQFFSSELDLMYKEKKWTRNSQWTDGVHTRLAEIGHRYGFRVFATPDRCTAADGPEWLYDHHWRIESEEGVLVRVPLVMEIEWGFDRKTIVKEITKDFLKLVQARADLRVMVFHYHDVISVTDKLIDMVENFEGTRQGDRYLFAGYGWDTNQMHCKLWSA